MDAMERTALHEAYVAPTVGVGNLVLFKRRHRQVWELGIVFPPQSINWKPGDPVGKQISICVLAGNPACKVEENCVHIKDPYYIYDDQRQRSCWELISNISGDEMKTAYAEILAKVMQLETTLEETKQHLNNTMTELSKMSASRSQQRGRLPTAPKDELTHAS